MLDARADQGVVFVLDAKGHARRRAVETGGVSDKGVTILKGLSAGDSVITRGASMVRDGDAVFSPRLAGFVLDAFSGDAPPEVGDPELDQLSPREREVMRLIARGYTYKEIARRLTLSVKTVETHVSAVLRKLQLSSRHELTRWATERRIV